MKNIKGNEIKEEEKKSVGKRVTYIGNTHSSYLFEDEVNLSFGFHVLFWPFTLDMCG